MNDIKKVALITGSGRGIGREIALELARNGIDIALADINFPDNPSTKKDIEALGRKAIELTVNVSNQD